MKVRKCDKCGAEIAFNVSYDSFSIFEGSLSMEEFDLCYICQNRLQEILDKFSEKQEEK